MLEHKPSSGDLFKIPEGVVVYRCTPEHELIFCDMTQKPLLAIFIEQYSDGISKIVLHDQIRYVRIDHLCQIGDRDVNQINWHT